MKAQEWPATAEVLTVDRPIVGLAAAARTAVVFRRNPTASTDAPVSWALGSTSLGTRMRSWIQAEHVPPAAGRLGHRPELDGLRGIAVALVVLAHAGVAGVSLGGQVGVEMFFVLSGFLITTMLLEGDRLDLRNFYARRARRLLPALILFLVVMGAAAAVVGDRRSMVGVGVGATYVSNVARVRSIDLGWLNHLWSLAVEEHFYLLWPLVVIGCGRRSRTVGLAAAFGLVTSAAWRYELAIGGTGWNRLYNGTDTRICGILAGAVLSVLVRQGLRMPVTALGGFGLLLLLKGSLVAVHPFGIGFLAVDLAAAVVILGAVSRPSAVLRFPPLVALGQVSYAVYLWHVPIFMWLGHIEHLTTAQTAEGCSATMVVAWASMRFLEERWRRPPCRQDADVGQATSSPRGRVGGTRSDRNAARGVSAESV